MEGVAARAIRDATSCQQTDFFDCANLGPIFSLAHYYEQHGDLMRDPEMLFIQAEDGGYYPVEIWQDAVNSHSVGVLIEDEKAVSIDETKPVDMTVFAEVWLKNIRQQQQLGEAL